MMKPLTILLLLAAPLPALAQTAPVTHDEAQRIVRAEAERWRYPLIEQGDDGDTAWPDVIGVIVTSGNAPRCQTDYTITFPAFTRDGKRHAQVARDVTMLWSASARHAIVNGTTVTLTWRDHMTTYDWNLETETPERAQAFAAAADFLTDLCATENDPKNAVRK
jgi:hypothetical protein